MVTLKGIMHWFLPSFCTLCHMATKEKMLCQACWDALPWHDGMACARCAGSLSAGEICGECMQNAPPYQQTICVFYYQKPMDSLILSLKFAEKLSHAKLIGSLMAEKLTAHYTEKEKPQYLIPVPLHPTRLRERGYNQALEIARPIAKKLCIPIQKTVCTRILPTLSQASRNAKKRKKNMRNAFAIATPFQAKYVAIVDDVLTTGSTVREVAQLFKKAGVSRIDVWCCAKTALHTGGLMSPIS
jgi:ComF family protein